jgi:glycosyltransferase involved in cell wall biosynthesis
MSKCIDSLLPGGDEVEIIIVNDGSRDETLAIARTYQEDYPSIIRVIDKENGGHGSAVNAGLEAATGLYFKVVDSDDWLKAEAYRKVLNTIRRFSEGENAALQENTDPKPVMEEDDLIKGAGNRAGDSGGPDLIICNFVYEKEGESRHKVMRYGYALPEERLFEWQETKYFQKGRYMLMHSVIFRTKLLQECELRLPEHTFYVDNLFVFIPLAHVKTMYYLNANFYRYYIGREGQSVNEKIHIARIDQQILINKMMVDYLAENKATIKRNRKLYRYMVNYLEIVTIVSCVLLIISGTEENLAKKHELWRYMAKKDWFLHKRLRYGFLGGSTNLPGRCGRRISVEGYKLCRRFFKFN